MRLFSPFLPFVEEKKNFRYDSARLLGKANFQCLQWVLEMTYFPHPSNGLLRLHAFPSKENSYKAWSKKNNILSHVFNKPIFFYKWFIFIILLFCFLFSNNVLFNILMDLFQHLLGAIPDSSHPFFTLLKFVVKYLQVWTWNLPRSL